MPSLEERRKEAGDRAIADKIIKRLHDLEKTIEKNQGRWGWELLQNAKDSVASESERKVCVQIQLNEDSVEFRHNGNHFTIEDITGLISQISSKEVNEGEQTQKTGRFGTGFLTTHLLSRVIEIKGVVKEDDAFDSFNFLLDRCGKTTGELIPKITQSWTDFEQSRKKVRSEYDNTKFPTAFNYILTTDSQKAVARIGIHEFIKLIPYVLAFNRKLSKVEIIDRVRANNTSFELTSTTEKFTVDVLKVENSKEETISILHHSNDRISIATEIERDNFGYSVKGVKDLPKIFCDFPLIGTENFYFPVIVNSFFFHPQTERDGIWLKGSEEDSEVNSNKRLIEEAVTLYKELVVEATNNKFYHLYNLVETNIPATDKNYFDESWYKDAIQAPLNEFILDSKIIEIEGDESLKISPKDLYTPKKSFSKEVKGQLWQFLFDLNPSSVCKRDHLHDWSDVLGESGHSVDYQTLLELIAELGSVENLSEVLRRDENGTLEWINILGHFILENDGDESLLNKCAVIPNQYGRFKIFKTLFVDEIQDSELLDVLELLGDDWKDILLHEQIEFARDLLNHKSKINIAQEITRLSNLKRLDKPLTQGENFIKAISALCEWFENSPEEARTLFSELYSNRAELFMNTIQDKDSLYKIMRVSPDLSKLYRVASAIEGNAAIFNRPEDLNVLSDLLREFNASNISDLRSILLQNRADVNQNIKKIELNSQTLLSLGITSQDDLEKYLLQNADIADKFFHESTPTSEMFEYVQKLIERSKKRVKEYLESKPRYDCSNWEEMATTVIGGVQRDGIEIKLVIRPSDNNEVIFYYGSEKQTLDSFNSELWIDNGKETPRALTLGKILQTTGITRIPV